MILYYPFLGAHFANVSRQPVRRRLKSRKNPNIPNSNPSENIQLQFKTLIPPLLIIHFRTFLSQYLIPSLSNLQLNGNWFLKGNDWIIHNLDDNDLLSIKMNWESTRANRFIWIASYFWSLWSMKRWKPLTRIEPKAYFTITRNRGINPCPESKVSFLQRLFLVCKVFFSLCRIFSHSWDKLLLLIYK